MKKCASVILLFMLMLTVKAQRSNIIPPAPTTREFNKYINFDVSLYHGIPEISIPLYNIQLKDISIPITLSYHASGIKFGQTSGNVGLGWVINPGYRVSRTVHGYPDEVVAMPANITDQLTQYETSSVANHEYERDKFLSKFAVSGSNLFGISDKLDGEYDQFNFSFPDHSGSFIISDRLNKTIVSPEEPNSIFKYREGQSSYTTASGIVGFNITDDKGIKYSFGEYGVVSGATVEVGNTSNGAGKIPAMAWGLTEVTSPSNETVKMSYTQGIVGENSIDYNKTYNVLNSTSGGFCVTSSTSLSNNDEGYYKTIFPAEIITKNERVVFNHTFQTNKNQLNRIFIYSSAGKAIKNVRFFYHDGNYAYTSYYLLDSIQICSGDSNLPLEIYRFNYYANPYEGYKTTSRDQWGYLMEGNPDNYFDENFADDPVLIKETSDGQVFYPNQWKLSNLISNFSRRERKSYDPVPNAYSIKKISYPTGGSTEYEFEHNIYSGSTSSGTNPGNLMVAGIRVSKITSFDKTNNKLLERSYKYGVKEDGYGEASIQADHQLFVNEGLHFARIDCGGPTIETYYQRNITYSSSMQGDAGSDVFQSGFVVYPEVAEYFSGSSAGVGKIVHSFHTGSPYKLQRLDRRTLSLNPVYNDFFPINIADYRSWDKPYLESNEFYNQSNKLIKKEAFTYDTFNQGVLTGLKVKSSVSIDGFPRPEYYSESNRFTSYYDYGLYTISMGRRMLTGKTVEDYSGTDKIVTHSDYVYANNLLSKETIKSSSGDNLVSYTTYPADYAAGTVFVDDMKKGNLLNYPIEKVGFLDKNGKQTIRLGIANYYKTGGLGMVESEWRFESTKLLNASEFKFSNLPLGVLPFGEQKTSFLLDSRYKKRVSYDVFDSQGNIVQFHKENGNNISYIWGYNKSYPIAQIVNASVDDCAYTSFETRDETANGWTFENSIYEDDPGKKYPNIKSGFAVTGERLYNLGFSSGITKSNLDPAKTYVLSFYYKFGRPQIIGTNVTLITERSGTGQNMSFCKFELKGGNTVKVNGGTNIYIDDLRICPKNAEMTTFTYEPLVGMTSQTDPKGQTSYYEYDNYQRLYRVRDQDGHIVKQYCYNYAGQQTDCSVPAIPEQPSQSGVIYARLEKSNEAFWTDTSDPNNRQEQTHADFNVVFYSDAACKTKLTLSAPLDIKVNLFQKEVTGYGGDYESSTDYTYHVLAGADHYNVGNNTLTYYSRTYPDPQYGSWILTDTGNFDYSLIVNGDSYIVSPAI